MEKSHYKPLQQFNKISFYVVAHADDWQLFMYPNVYTDLVSPDCKVIFIITTAGDAGMGEQFWRAREEGLKSSLRFCLAPFSMLSEFIGTREFNSHCISYWLVNNTTSYFLRLPDGNLDSNGFGVTNFQSLSKLKLGKINTLTALDNSTACYHWSDLINAIESVISSESHGISNVWIHYLNPDPGFNPGDHIDHITTGHAIQSMTMITKLHQVLYTGYSVRSIGENLSLSDSFWKTGMFAAYEKAVYDLCGYSTLQENTDLYVKWCCSKSKFIKTNPTH